MEKLFIPILLGTARDERESEKVANFIFREFERREEINTELIDIRDYLKSETIPSWVESTKTDKWKKVMEKSDALIIVSPEYNHGYPGELKLLLDSALKEYDRKPVGICGVSDGQFAGARLADHIKPVLVTMGFVPIKRAVLFDHVDTLFDKEGKIKDEANWQKKAKGFFDEIIWFAKVLKEGTKNYPDK